MRIRDPIHGLIVFSNNKQNDKLAWDLIDAKEFQRLRRIKQLGFSELVYPGATHTRFSHSIGVFHMTRAIIDVLKEIRAENFDNERAEITACAALLHDIGHGPFSHAFEGANKKIGRTKKHEVWTTEIIRGNTEIGEILECRGRYFREKVAAILEEEFPSDIYASIVHSQFDADRLDYLRRDKYMTGTEHGGFDWAWLLNNLEVGTVTVGEDDPVEIETFILASKGLQAAEEYLLGRFHLYTQVYMHKTTRGAEKILEALLQRTAIFASSGDFAKMGIPENHPLISFFIKDGDNLSNYLGLDDAVLWGALQHLAQAKDVIISELANRLLYRKLYKCFDVGMLAKHSGGDSKVRFTRALKESIKNGDLSEIDVLQDRVSVNPYKYHNYDSSSALEKILLRPDNKAKNHDDIARYSNVISGIRGEDFFRVYCRNPKTVDKIQRIWNEIENDGQN